MSFFFVACAPRLGTVCAQRRHSLPLSMEQLAAWLEEKRGWFQPLGELHGRGKWSLKNVVKEGMSVTKQMNLVWTAIMAEWARMIADTGAEPPSPLDQTLAVQWALTPTALFTLGSTVTREEETATIDTPHTRDASYGRTNLECCPDRARRRACCRAWSAATAISPRYRRHVGSRCK